MSDEHIEQEERSTPTHHELSETPFGANKTGPDEEPETPELDKSAEEQPEEPTAEQPQPEEPEQEEAEPISMEEAMAMADRGGAGVDYSGTFKSLTEGDVVDGVVVHIDHEGVLVDVGTKSEGTVKPNELSRDPSLSPEEVVSVGDKIRVYVVKADSQDGGPILSKKRADFENAWDRVEKASTTGEVLKAMVTDRVKGGLVVDLGIRGFVPASHVGSGKIKNLEKFVGQSMQFKVIEVDRDRRKVVLSNRLAVEEEREAMRKETMASIAEGQVRDGVVRRITDYGAFVDLGGVDGLLHVSEMSWTRINHPSEAVKVGQKIQVMVLRLDLSQGRVSLGLRQILPDPWVEIRRIHSVGNIIKGTVTRLVPFGAFVQVEGGVEGIIPNSELAVQRVSKPEEVVSQGQEVEVKVIDLRPDERRMTLSLRQLQADHERERDQREYRTYEASRPESRTTIGDLIGDRLGDLASAMSEPPKATKRKSKARAARKEAMEEAEALAEAEEFAEELAPESEGEEAVEEAAAEQPEEAVAEEEQPAAEAEQAEVEAIATVEEVVGEPEKAEPEKAEEEAAAEPEAEAPETVEEEAKPAEEAEPAAEEAEAEPSAEAETAEEAEPEPKPKAKSSRKKKE